jgi:hypothetical protein
MVLDAAQSVLGYFGFDRTVYGDKRNTTPRKWKWLQELRQQEKMISRLRCWKSRRIIDSCSFSIGYEIHTDDFATSKRN